MAFLFGQGIYGNFNKTTVGLANLSFNGGTQAGFLKGNLKANYDNKPLDFTVGTPLQFAGRTIIEYMQSVSGEFAEIDALQISLNLGSGLSGFTPISAGTVTWPPTGVSHVLTWGLLPSGRLGVFFPGGNLTSPIVKTPDGTTTTYTQNTDYLLEPGSNIVPGSIEVIPGSSLATAITGGQATAYFSVTIGVPSSLRVYPGQNFTVVQIPMLLITHLRPNGGKFIKHLMPLAMAKGNASFDYSEGKYMLTPFEFTAIPAAGFVDDQGNTAPYGYIDVQQ